MPAGLAELWQARDRAPAARLYAGGTDLLVRRRQGLEPAGDLICLERVAELRGVGREGGRLRLGAAASFRELLAAPELRSGLPLLARALEVLGSPQVRAMGTLGGNLATASPAGDSLPALYALGAEVELASAAGSRRLPVGEFILGPGRTALEPGEVIAAVLAAPPAGFGRQHYQKVGQRRALAISIASLAALLEVEDGAVRRARLAWGSLGPTVVVSPEAEGLLAGRPLTPEGLAPAAEAARRAVAPITDLRASAEHRRALAGNLVLRLAHLPAE
jgi:xanthine dehydrogenase FAD-binding subunit